MERDAGCACGIGGPRRRPARAVPGISQAELLSEARDEVADRRARGCRDCMPPRAENRSTRPGELGCSGSSSSHRRRALRASGSATGGASREADRGAYRRGRARDAGQRAGQSRRAGGRLPRPARTVPSFHQRRARLPYRSTGCSPPGTTHCCQRRTSRPGSGWAGSSRCCRPGAPPKSGSSIRRWSPSPRRPCTRSPRCMTRHTATPCSRLWESDCSEQSSSSRSDARPACGLGKAAALYPPTATHAFTAAHETPLREFSLVLGLPVVWIFHPMPFQTSASVTCCCPKFVSVTAHGNALARRGAGHPIQHDEARAGGDRDRLDRPARAVPPLRQREGHREERRRAVRVSAYRRACSSPRARNAVKEATRGVCRLRRCLSIPGRAAPSLHQRTLRTRRADIPASRFARRHERARNRQRAAIERRRSGHRLDPPGNRPRGRLSACEQCQHGYKDPVRPPRHTTLRHSGHPP